MLIYILEDDEGIRELEAFAMKNSGYDTECFENSNDFYKAISKKVPELILLDIMLPGDDGLTVLTKLRDDPVFRQIPVIIISAKTTELDRVKGLDLGADDYLCKPFGVMELVSRVRARLRGAVKTNELTFEEITLSLDKRSVTAGGVPIELTYKEFELLKLFMQSPRTVFQRDNILDRIWGHDSTGRTLDVHIRTLRAKLSEYGRYIVTAIVGILITTVSYYSFFRKEVKENLAHECHLVAECYESTESADELERFTDEDFRITLIEKDGTVLFESDADSLAMSNHLDRLEIKAAIENGTGTDTRFSDTIGTEDHYYALRLDDGSILRVSIQADSIFALFERSLIIILVIIIGIIIVSLIVSMKLTEKLISPLKRIPELIRTNKSADESDIYPEIIPLVEEIQSVRNSQSEMRQEFTANVSHELKTPLTSISGYAELIETGMAQGKDSIRFAGKIRSESARMLTLISDIIRLSELDTIEGDTLDEDIDLKELSEECREQLLHTAEQRGINITLSGDSDMIKGSRIEIHELIYNLVDNAIKYNRDNGNIEIKISGRSLTVSDTGIGIPQESIPRIFERFYRADKSRSRAKGGTGLGLSIVRHIAEHHGAEIGVESTVNVGTKITVLFK